VTDGRAAVQASQTLHTPVLLQETMAWLQPRPGGLYIDGTIGMGGHAEAILERSSPDGRLLAIDRDPQALDLAQQRLAAFGDRVVFERARFDAMAEVAARHGFAGVQGVLLDLGVSSLQLSDAERGFSFQQEGPLDMRMGPDAPATADEIVNTWPEVELARIIYTYGEERRSRRVARAIVAARPLRTTLDLATVVARAVGRGGRTSGGRSPRERIHPATRTFQALRIAVNGELEALEAALPQAVALLAPGGRLAVIAFHSLEDRIVKQFMARESTDCVCPPRQPQCTCGHRATVRRLTRKPVMADDAEIARNPRSRSARLRVAERLPEAR